MGKRLASYRQRSVQVTELIPPIADSALSMSLMRIEPGESAEVVAEDGNDLMLFAFAGAGTASGRAARAAHASGQTALDACGSDDVALAYGTALHVAAGERATVRAGTDGLALVRIAITHAADEHAALGERPAAVQLDLSDPTSATGSRSFQVLLGPEHGCCRATLFVGVVPPGAAPWHFHQYDEIIWLLEGHGAYHRADGSVDEMGQHAAVRIRPREVHINENRSGGDMHVLGVFTPAGSPSAAYLATGADLPPHPSDA